MKKLRVIACLAVLALLLPVLTRLRGELPMDAQPLIEKKYGGWAGVLRLWVCEDWQTASGWLNRCIASYEKSHPGVYIQPEYVDAGILRSLGKDGLAPDMVLFPPGRMESGDNLAVLEGDYPLREGLAVSDRAVPVLMGGYVWACNVALLEDLPRDWQSAEGSPALPPDDGGHLWSAALLGLCSGRYSDETPSEAAEPGEALELGLSDTPLQTTPSPAPSEGPLRCRLPVGFEANADAWQDFLNGDAAAIPVTQREVRQLQAMSDQGRGVDWVLRASGSAFTDQALYIGVTSGIDADKNAQCMAFVSHLLGDDCQSQLHRAGAFPVTDADPGYPAADPLRIMDRFLRLQPPVMPAPFGGEWRERATPIVRKFLAGDPDPAVLWAQLSEISEHSR